jgi:hypothetical protein
MSEFFKKNWWAWLLILIIVIVILGVVRLMGGSTWADWFGLQLFNFGVFWGQRPLNPEVVGLIGYGAMIILIIIVIIVIYFFRGTFFKKE